MGRFFERFVELSGKTAVVVGASNSMGAGISKVLAAAGASVGVNYVSTTDEDPGQVVAEIKAKGGEATLQVQKMSKKSL
jgi:3-oxoacyl-[acyl-carrier protein] reductase